MNDIIMYFEFKNISKINISQKKRNNITLLCVIKKYAFLN